jgi:hypothetical protein
MVFLHSLGIDVRATSTNSLVLTCLRSVFGLSPLCGTFPSLIQVPVATEWRHLGDRTATAQVEGVRMRTLIGIARMLVRLLGTIMIVLGLLFWTGNALAWLAVHMLIGLVAVLTLWTLTTLATRAGEQPALVGAALLSGLLVPILGMTQDQLLPGPVHWTIKVLPSLLGVGAIALAEVLARRALDWLADTRPRPVAQPDSGSAGRAGRPERARHQKLERGLPSPTATRRSAWLPPFSWYQTSVRAFWPRSCPSGVAGGAVGECGRHGEVRQQAREHGQAGVALGLELAIPPHHLRRLFELVPLRAGTGWDPPPPCSLAAAGR